MAINFNNQNQGIGSINLGDFGLQQPEENMTVAEVFNTPQSLMEIGAAEPGMFSGYNLTDQGEVLEDFRNSAVKMRNATGSPTYNQGIQSQFNRMLSIPSSFKDVIKNQEYIQDAINKGFLKEKSDFKNQKSFANPDDLQAMAISNYDQLFGPRTMTDANQSLYTGVMDRSGTPIDYTDRIRQQNLPGFASQPQYRIRDQLKRDFLEGGLFKDAKQSLGQTKDAFLEDVSGLRNMIGSGINNAKEGIMGSSAMDFLRGLPTPGNLLMSIASGRNPLNPKSANYNIALQSQIDTMKDKGMYGTNPTSGLGQITGGRLAGKNLVSMFGSNDLGEMYGKDLSKLEGYLATMPQRFSRLMKNNPAAYQKKIDNLNKKIKQNKFEQQQIENAAREKTRQMAAANRAAGDRGGYQAGYGRDSDFMGGSGTAAEMGSSAMGGIIGHGGMGGRPAQSGIASMFTRRG